MFEIFSFLICVFLSIVICEKEPGSFLVKNSVAKIWKATIFVKINKDKEEEIMQKNEAQEEAIQTIDGQLIVIACPGSGKTTTMVRRIHHMTADCKIPSEHILMITFTAAAAKEMKERYQKQYGVDQTTFCTIHSLCLAILRKFRGLTNENIMSNQQSFFYEQLKRNKDIRDKDEFIKLLITDISVVKNNSLDIDTFVPQCTDDKVLFERLYNKYEDYKKQMDLIDFDDMLIQAYDCMRFDFGCLEWLREKYQYIQVDEFQDTNFLQRDIVYLLAGDNGNLAVVGDDDQSIYGFRGARPEVMLTFQEHYPDVKFIRMNINYRSCKEIISIADRLIQQNTSRFDKQFLAFHSEEGQVEEIRKETRMAQLLAATTKIEELQKAGENLDDIAILFRTNQEAEEIASLLMNRKIPFYSREKIKSRYDHWMFEDIKSFQKLATGTGNKQDLSKVLNHPNRFLNDYRYIQAGMDQKKMSSVAFQMNSEKWKLDKALENISNFFWGIRALKDKKPTQFLSTLNVYMNYQTYVKEYAKWRNMDYNDLLTIWNQYVADAARFEDWSDWGKYIFLYNKALREAQNNQSGVVLSTMHSSKGLEWKHVFIIDCVDGICPYKKAETPAAIEEERRLFYVAMTRAKEHLYLCSYESDGRKDVRISPFVHMTEKNVIAKPTSEEETSEGKVPSKKYYAVRRGKQRGIYTTWADCKKQTEGYPYAEHKSFKTYEEAKKYLEG